MVVAQPVVGLYVSAGAGADFLLKSELPADRCKPSPRTYRFDVEPAGFVSLGYGFGNGLRVKLEGDYAHNHVRDARFTTPNFLTPLQAGGSEQQYGGFANMFADLPVPLPVTPYLGARIGYRQIELEKFGSAIAPGNLDPGFINDGSPSLAQLRGSFAYQGIAGISAPLPFCRPCP